MNWLVFGAGFAAGILFICASIAFINWLLDDGPPTRNYHR